jgi:uncharacterized coiled-coil DUF342 family protein
MDDAIEELARVRRELVAANRGAETNAKVNQGLCTRLAEAERERDEARRDLVAAEELHRRRFGTLKSEYDAACAILAEAERERDQARRERDEALKEWDESMEVLDKALEDRNELRKKLDDSDVVITRLITERTQAREVAKLAFYIIRGVDPKFVKLAYERSVYWNGQDQPIQFMRDAIKKWDKEQKEKAK